MAIYLVSYDLIGPKRDYDKIAKHLETYENYLRPLESVWLIETDDTASEVRDAAKSHVDSNDKLLVLKVDPSAWAIRNVGTTAAEWIRKNL